MHLIACPECSRQFDVTSLLPESRVRCACDEVLVVGFRGPRAVSALHCRHCGGIVKVDEDACSYCAAALSEPGRVRTRSMRRYGARTKSAGTWTADAVRSTASAVASAGGFCPGSVSDYGQNVTESASVRLKFAPPATGSLYQNWKFQVEPGSTWPEAVGGLLKSTVNATKPAKSAWITSRR